MNTYSGFIDFCEKMRFRFNPGIVLEANDCFSSELRLLLSIRNGEMENAEHVFRRTFSGRFIYYKFISWNEIMRISTEINSNPVFVKNISKDLLHFAVHSTPDNHYEYTSTFAISRTNEIFKCKFSEYDRFNLVQDIGQVRFSSNMEEFLNTQRQLISWDFQDNYKFR